MDTTEATPARPVIFLHIGAMKTGTTFLQALMIANKDNLAAAGYCFPGRRWHEQDKATRDVLGMDRDDPAMRASTEGMWDTLAHEMLTHPGRASIFSMEFLSFASRTQAARIVDSLSAAEVHIILTVRDAVGAIPAQWQTHSRNRGKASWPAYARSARRSARLGRFARGEGARIFQKGQGVPRMLRAWGSAVPPERLHVITVPPPGSDPSLLWQRFAGVVGLDPAVCTHSAGRTNPSLGLASADLMRRINLELGKIPVSDYQPTLKAKLANGILAARSTMEPGAKLDRRTRAFALGWNKRVRAAITRSGADLVGHLDDLPVRTSQTTAEYVARLSDPPAEDVLAAAAAARDGLVRLVDRRAKRVTRLGGQVQATLDQADAAGVRGGFTVGAEVPTPQGRWSAEPDPVAAAAAELAALARRAIDLRSQAASLKNSSVGSRR